MFKVKSTVKKYLSKFEKSLSEFRDIYIKRKFTHHHLLNDQIFNLNLVDKGFEDRLATNNNEKTKANLERICAAYVKAKKVQKQSDDAYQVGNEWIPIYDVCMAEVSDALINSDIEKLRKIYLNFFRENCSVGLHGLPCDMKKEYFSGNISKTNKILFLFDYVHRYRLWQSILDDNFSTSDLESPTIGNPYGCYIDEKFVMSGSDYLHYYATAIGRLLKTNTDSTKRVICEIGGGFGGMAYYLLRDNNLSYVDFDLPENMSLAAYYLMEAFPEKKVLLYGEFDDKLISKKLMSEYDIIILPNFCLGAIEDDACDVFFNSYSLAEMSENTINTYFSFINKIVTQYILHINHNKNSKVIADKFPVDKNKFQLIHKFPALWNKARNSEMDEFEYLYRRIG